MTISNKIPSNLQFGSELEVSAHRKATPSSELSTFREYVLCVRTRVLLFLPAGNLKKELTPPNRSLISHRPDSEFIRQCHLPQVNPAIYITLRIATYQYNHSSIKILRSSLSTDQSHSQTLASHPERESRSVSGHWPGPQRQTHVRTLAQGLRQHSLVSFSPVLGCHCPERIFFLLFWSITATAQIH
jgi:hypothetical protein